MTRSSSLQIAMMMGILAGIAEPPMRRSNRPYSYEARKRDEEKLLSGNRENRRRRYKLRPASCRPPQRGLIKQAPYIEAPRAGFRYEKGRLVAR